MSSENVKKKRSPNFTASERQLFVDLLLPKYSEFIECKKTDHMTNEEKAKKWNELAEEFNALSSVHFRTVTNLQNLWDNLKKGARSAAAKEKKEVFLTGGGQVNKSHVLTDEDIKVLAHLGSSGVGLVNIYDGDSISQDHDYTTSPPSTAAEESEVKAVCALSTLDCSNIPVITEDTSSATVVSVFDSKTWGDTTPRILYNPKPNALRIALKEVGQSSSNGPSDVTLIRKKTLEEESEWAAACKRRRPSIAKPEPDENHKKLVAAKLELAVQAKKELDEKAERDKVLFEIEKRKKEMEVEIMALQLAKMKKELGAE